MHLPEPDSLDTGSRRLRLFASPWGWAAWLLPAGAVLFSSLQVGDLAYHIRAGELMWNSGSVLRIDPFTFTMAGEPWLNQQWGAQLVFGSLFSAVGWRGLLIAQSLLVAAVVGCTYTRTRGAGGDRPVSGALVIAAFATMALLPGAVALRPQLLAAPLFVFSAWAISSRHVRPQLLAWLPLIGVIWANVHGSFPLLPALLGIAFIDDVASRAPSARRTGGLAVACSLTPLVTPWGSDTYRYVSDVMDTPVVRELIGEWRPMLTRVPAGVAFTVASAGVIFLASCKAKRRASPGEIAGLAFFTLLTLWSARNVLWWGLYVPPTLGGLLAGWQPGSRWSRRATVWVAGALASLVLVGVVRVTTTQPAEELLSEAPYGTTLALRTVTTPGDHVFAAWWAPWFEFAVPEGRMFVDARAELFPHEVWDDYFKVINADGWQEVLQHWRVDVVVVSLGDFPRLEEALDADETWAVAHRDDEGAIFVRLDSI